MRLSMTITAAGIAAIVGAASSASAQPLEIKWYTIDGGGGRSTGGTFAITGTIGQPDAGDLTGGTFTIRGGFWDPPTAGSCPADFNSDGFVDIFDYDDFVTCFEGDACPPGKTADFNGDGFPDIFDYDEFVAAFETGCP